MSRLGRLPVDPEMVRTNWRSLVAQFLLAVALAGTALALLAYLFGTPGPLGDGSLAGMFDWLAESLPAVGALVALASITAAWYVRRSHQTASARAETEDSSTQGALSETTDHHREAVRAQYLCAEHPSLDRVEDLLVQGAVRTLRTQQGIDVQTARAAVRSGRWTDDRVAAAFLAEDLNYPLSERLYGRLDPGGAYHRRVRRTLDAIDATDRHGTPEVDR
jgi:hypothetical protein